MRTRNEIENEMEMGGENKNFIQETTIELLLDIRDLLANPPVEIVNEPLPTPLT